MLVSSRSTEPTNSPRLIEAVVSRGSTGAGSIWSHDEVTSTLTRYAGCHEATAAPLSLSSVTPDQEHGVQPRRHSEAFGQSRGDPKPRNIPPTGNLLVSTR